MALLGLFMLIWVGFIAATYFIGLAVETMWGSGASLLTFLILFFGSILVAWKAAVKLSEPKEIVDQSR